MPDNEFSITLESFNEGQSPLSHLDDKTFLGNRGHASDMKADIISNPGFLQQSPGLADLTNGNQDGVVSELLRFILDKPTAVDTTFAVGATKLYKLSSTAVINSGSWPKTVTGMVEGESAIRLKTNLYIFYNKASGGDIAKMPLDTEVINPTWGSVAASMPLENAVHASAVKEDIMVFTNGRYLGVYIEGSATIDPRKVDFGEGSEVVDVVFESNVWWIAVNYGQGRRSEVYIYDGSALSNILSDEVGVGNQNIGFLYVHNGNVYVAYEDKTSEGYQIGFIAGRIIKPLQYFKGSLPNHRQKTLYKNSILFVSGANVLSCGSTVDSLPIQVSTLLDAGLSTVGGIAAPFGIPMMASSQDTHFRIAKLSGYSTDSYWKSIFFDITKQQNLGKITDIIVQTKELTATAKWTLSIEANQAKITSDVPMVVSGLGRTRHRFSQVGLGGLGLEDFRILLSNAGGSVTDPCPIRKIIVLGKYVER